LRDPVIAGPDPAIHAEKPLPRQGGIDHRVKADGGDR
jgi:hypothetical protein